MSHVSLVDAPAWFTECAANNTREFWARRKDDYVHLVREPFLALLASAGEDPTVWRVYRPHRDTRFGVGAGPLKTFLGALLVAPDGTGRYLQIDSHGLLASSGLPYLAADQLPRWRAAVAAEPNELPRVLESARGRGATLKSGYPDPLKHVPRGYDPDHPRADLLRWKGVEAYGRTPDLVADPTGWLLNTWLAGKPLCTWLGTHVGPTALKRTR